MRAALSVFAAALSCTLAVACIPKRDLPPAQIKTLTSLKDDMDVQATVADPQFSKAGESSYTDADWAAFADMGTRLQVTTDKAHEFSKGPEFDALATRLHDQAAALAAAASSKDTPAASKLLGDMKATCKTCHSQFK